MTRKYQFLQSASFDVDGILFTTRTKRFSIYVWQEYCSIVPRGDGADDFEESIVEINYESEELITKSWNIPQLDGADDLDAKNKNIYGINCESDDLIQLISFFRRTLGDYSG